MHPQVDILCSLSRAKSASLTSTNPRTGQRSTVVRLPSQIGQVRSLQNNGNHNDSTRCVPSIGQFTASTHTDQSNATTSAATTGQPESTLSKAGTMAEDVGAGFVKGAGQTANTVSSVLNKIPVVGKYLAPTEGINAATEMETPTNTAQKVGVGAEGIAEFFLGDEALKGLSIAERLGMASKVAKLAESNPVIARIISGGLNAARTGTTSAAQSALHAPEGERGSGDRRKG
jgi:hypothetical protein